MPLSSGVFLWSRHRGPRFAQTSERSATGFQKQAPVTLEPHALAGCTGRGGSERSWLMGMLADPLHGVGLHIPMNAVTDSDQGGHFGVKG